MYRTLIFFDQTNDFDAKIVEPFIHQFTVELLNLVSDVEAYEIKRKVMQTLNVLIEQCGLLVSLRSI